MVFFTYSGAVTLNVQWCLLNLCSFQCLPIRSVINTHSYCCSTKSLVVLAEKRQLYQKPQVPSWLPISLHSWFWRCEAARPGQNSHLLESPSGILPCVPKLAGWMKMFLQRSPVHFEGVAASAPHELYCTSCPGRFYSLERQRKEKSLVSLFLTGLTKKLVSILHLEQHGLWHCHQFVCISVVRRELCLWGDQISLGCPQCLYGAAMWSWLMINRRTQKCLEYRKSQTELNYLPSFICLPWRLRIAF